MKLDLNRIEQNDGEKYFDFTGILRHIKETVSDTPYEECLKDDPCAVPGVNMDLLTKKDGKYAVRPLTLANPYLYYILTRIVFPQRMEGCP